MGLLPRCSVAGEISGAQSPPEPAGLGLRGQTVLHWAANLRWRASINQLSGSTEVEEFLKASPENSTDKVMHHMMIYFTLVM